MTDESKKVDWVHIGWVFSLTDRECSKMSPVDMTTYRDTIKDLLLYLAGPLEERDAAVSAARQEERERCADFVDVMADEADTLSQAFVAGSNPWARYRAHAAIYQGVAAAIREGK